MNQIEYLITLQNVPINIKGASRLSKPSVLSFSVMGFKKIGRNIKLHFGCSTLKPNCHTGRKTKSCKMSALGNFSGFSLVVGNRVVRLTYIKAIKFTI